MTWTQELRKGGTDLSRSGPFDDLTVKTDGGPGKLPAHRRLGWIGSTCPSDPLVPIGPTQVIGRLTIWDGGRVIIRARSKPVSLALLCTPDGSLSTTTSPMATIGPGVCRFASTVRLISALDDFYTPGHTFHVTGPDCTLESVLTPYPWVTFPALRAVTRTGGGAGFSARRAFRATLRGYRYTARQWGDRLDADHRIPGVRDAYFLRAISGDDGTTLRQRVVLLRGERVITLVDYGYAGYGDEVYSPLAFMPEPVLDFVAAQVR
jgi:hypothetical protein